ncbi:MAG TPA: hypothetical protein VMH27_20840 [Puia sp.]|nr:hypothetical protein [Puia sp.]
MRFSIAFACFLLALPTACKFTARRFKSPQFNSSTDDLSRELNHIVSCQHIHIDGNEVTANGEATSELEIDIINGRNVSTDTAKMQSMGNSIASIVRSALQDVNEYDTYQVRFVKVDSTEIGTKRQWTGIRYAAADLVLRKPKDPVFARSTDSLYVSLYRLVACKQFRTRGWIFSRGDERSSELDIEVVDSKSLPGEDDGLRALGERIAADSKRALADTMEYGVYKVSFVTEREDGSWEKYAIVAFRSFEL